MGPASRPAPFSPAGRCLAKPIPWHWPCGPCPVIGKRAVAVMPAERPDRGTGGCFASRCSSHRTRPVSTCALRRRLPPPLLASALRWCPVRPAICRSPRRDAASRGPARLPARRPVPSGGAGMTGRMTRWSSPSPSPSARRFRERSCRPRPAALATFASPTLAGSAVRPSGRQDQPAGTFIRQWYRRNENIGLSGVSEARSYHPFAHPLLR